MKHHGTKLPSLSGKPRPVHWIILLALSLAFAALLDTVRLPAALLLGAMLAAILVAVSDGVPRISRRAFAIAQGIVGCLVARGISSEILASLRNDWLLFVTVTITVILACAGMGWFLARKQVLPGTTAVWGCSPGGAAVMTLMSDSYGGDMRLVAVMQYLRVIIVTVLATIVSHLWIGSDYPTQSIFAHWSGDIAWLDLGSTLLLAAAGSLAAQKLKIPGGALLGPLIAGSILQSNGVLHITLPPWILAPTYLVLGWSIGLRFTRQALSQAAQALPSMIVSIACLVAACVGIALGLTRLTDIDPLTAYLATSPGGLDSVAIIASASGANVSFVMAFQTARLLLVVFTGPALARFVAGRLQTQA